MIVLTSGGSLTLCLMVVGPLLGFLGPGFDGHSISLIWFGCCTAVAAVLNQALAISLNSVASPEGRRWQPDGGPHHLEHFPLQCWTPVPPAVWAGVATWHVWVTVAPWAGIAAGAGAALVWIVVKMLWSTRRPGSWPAVLPPAYMSGGSPRAAARVVGYGLLVLGVLAVIVYVVTRVVLSAYDLPR